MESTKWRSVNYLLVLCLNWFSWPIGYFYFSGHIILLAYIFILLLIFCWRNCYFSRFIWHFHGILLKKDIAPSCLYIIEEFKNNYKFTMWDKKNTYHIDYWYFFDTFIISLHFFDIFMAFFWKKILHPLAYL